MQDIRFHCEHCDKHLVVDAAGAGLGIACPQCGRAIVIPTMSTERALQTPGTQTATGANAAPDPPAIPQPDAGGPPCPRCGAPMSIRARCEDTDSEHYPDGGVWCHCPTCFMSHRICPVCGQELRWIGAHADQAHHQHGVKHYGCGCRHHALDLVGRILKSATRALALALLILAPLAVFSVLFTPRVLSETRDPHVVVWGALSIALFFHVLFVLIPLTAFKVWEFFWHLYRVSWAAKFLRGTLLALVSLFSLSLSVGILRQIDWYLVPWHGFLILAALYTATGYSLYRVCRLLIETMRQTTSHHLLRRRIARFRPWSSLLANIPAAPPQAPVRPPTPIVPDDDLL